MNIRSLNNVERADLGKAGVDDQIQKTAKNLVPHQDGEVEITNDHGTRVLNCIREMTRSSERQADHVQTKGECEEFSDLCVKL